MGYLGDVKLVENKSKILSDAISEFRGLIYDAIKKRRSSPQTSEIMLDVILDYHADNTNDDELAISDAITYVVGSQHTSWNCKFTPFRKPE